MVTITDFQWIASGDMQGFETLYMFFGPVSGIKNMGKHNWDYALMQQPDKDWELTIIRKGAIEELSISIGGAVRALRSPPIPNNELVRLLLSLDNSQWRQR